MSKEESPDLVDAAMFAENPIKLLKVYPEKEANAPITGSPALANAAFAKKSPIVFPAESKIELRMTFSMLKQKAKNEIKSIIRLENIEIHPIEANTEINS